MDERIRDGFVRAYEMFKHGGNAGRDGMILALHLVIVHMETTTSIDKSELLTPLRVLLKGTFDLNNGSPPPFLKISKTHAKVRASDMRLGIQGFAAGALQVLTREKVMNADQAAKSISAKLRQLGFLMEGRKPVTLRALQSWQTSAKKDPLSKSRLFYDQMVNMEFDKWDKENLEVEIMELLQHVIEGFRVKDF